MVAAVMLSGGVALYLISAWGPLILATALGFLLTCVYAAIEGLCGYSVLLMISTQAGRSLMRVSLACLFAAFISFVLRDYYPHSLWPAAGVLTGGVLSASFFVLFLLRLATLLNCHKLTASALVLVALLLSSLTCLAIPLPATTLVPAGLGAMQLACMAFGLVEAIDEELAPVVAAPEA